MRMKRILDIVLVTLFLASAVLMVVTPAAAIIYEKKLPGDVDENNELTKDELASAILPYMLDEGNLKLDDVGDAAWVYAYWNGKPNTCEDQGKLDLFGTDKGTPRSLTLYRPVERIVALSSVEAVRSLKATDKIAGVSRSTTQNKVYYPEFFGCDFLIADSKDMESIIDLHPDVAIMGSSTAEHNIDVLESAGIVVFRSVTNTPQDNSYVEGHRKMGYLLDKEDEAEELIGWYEGILNSIKETVEENIPEENKPTAYWQHCWADKAGKYTTTGRGVYHENIVAAGGRNVFEGVGGFKSMRGYARVDVEAILDLDPDVMVWCGYAGPIRPYDMAADTTMIKDIYEGVVTRPELQNMTAVKEDRVIVIDYSFVCCGGLSRHFVGIAYMAKFFYPDLFTDLNPKAIHQEYLTRFQGLNINLDEKAAFAYSEPE